MKNSKYILLTVLLVTVSFSLSAQSTAADNNPGTAGAGAHLGWDNTGNSPPLGQPEQPTTTTIQQ